MWTVRYYLLGDWYEMNFCDYSSARAFAVGFLDWQIINFQQNFFYFSDYDN